MNEEASGSSEIDSKQARSAGEDDLLSGWSVIGVGRIASHYMAAPHLQVIVNCATSDLERRIKQFDLHNNT